MIGYIHSIESFATFEGKGIRTAVFMSGCFLRCAFCHNPDTWQIGVGEKISPDDLCHRITRFKPYFSRGGGVTFSGGEPLLQAQFILDTTKLLKQRGINCAIDTSASMLNETVRELYLAMEFVIVDLKFPTKEEYISECLSDSIDTVIATLTYLNDMKIPVILRTVVIPGINDTTAYIDAYYNIIKDFSN
ncbi:MAG: radical SAM protein, partial [Christensenellaceae bacterium]|nr:radical SAM protein [Christensenellaceae bacterium]